MEAMEYYIGLAQELLSDPQTWMYVGLLVLGLITGRVLGKLQPSRSTPGQVSVDVPGLPLIGNAIALGRHGATFIAACRHKYGDVFTLSLVGQKMQFWLETPLVHYFFAAPEDKVTFRPAVEQFTQRVFGLPSKDFFPKHAKVLQDLRELLVPSVMTTHAAALAAALEKRLNRHLPCGEEVDLYLATRRLVFGAGVETLFGASAFTVMSETASETDLEAQFYDFECGFELAASPVPHGLQTHWCETRGRLLEWLGKVALSDGFEDTTAGQLLRKADLTPDLAPHLLLAVLWASQANTVAATFWTLALLLLPEHQHWKQAVLEELQSLAQGLLGAEVSVSARAAVKALDRRSAACRCAAEAVRLRVQSIDVRMAASSFEITTSGGNKVPVPKGAVIALCPYLNHLDPAVYPNPTEFQPDRANADLGNHASPIVNSVAGLAFGAGSYRCPGRFFAEMEVALIAQIILAHRDLSLVTSTSTSSVDPDSPATTASNRQKTQQVPDGRQQNSNGAHLPEVQSVPLEWYDKILVGLLGKEVAMWGCGAGLVVPLPVEAAQAAGAAASLSADSAAVAGRSADWWLHHSGDACGRLPRMELRRLVGVKAPSGACMVTVKQLQSS